MINTKLIHSGRIQTAFIAAFALLLLIAAMTLLLHRPAEAQVNDKAVGNVSVTSPNPGELSVSWDAPGDAPDDYRVTWKKSSEKWPSYEDDNTVDGGNAFPTATSHTATGLEEGTEYSVRVRARYHDGNGNVEQSGPWSTSVEITVAAQTPPPSPPPPPPSTPPAKPTGLSTSPRHNSVALSWTDPGDSSITSYQILRGPNAANLAVLVDNTGSGSLSYTDSTVAAETTYAYAIKARNAHGLSPQADAVSVTTPAAPVETPVPEQLPSAGFTLDGQALDTGGACSQDDISSVSDDCTINITTRSPVFAVRGTVDSDDRLTVRTGRDSAAVDAATATADQDDLRGADRTAALSLAEGRHLLRVWADEDTTPGGSEEHFFRVNVLPYWELNGQKLSRDSDCQSTSAPELAAITDSDCIVTQSGNTGSIRFHNVTTEQFNAYVSVNGSEVVREPDDTALGDSFTLALQSGDNLLRVRLASKGNTHKAESYGRNAFYYKVTTPSTPAKPTGISYGASHDNALMFWTDPNDDSITGYQILRGEDADTLTVLEDDTGSASASYSDDTVEPETEYFYAIRARNAGGLGPQSDTVSVTTQAAPEEFLTELALAGAEFSLDGHPLDTTGTCSETDIGAISAGCTINIETKSPVFGVDGHIDVDDRIHLRIGRDKAAVDAASDINAHVLLRGTDDVATLFDRFPEGRNLLRLWGDEDEIAGGGEEHFFRVNVVPYWEWNGQRLSKDSACQASTAPDLAAITDANCILDSFKIPEVQFYNVLQEQFNVYVEVNGVRQVAEPGNTALAAPFIVNLEDGDNLVRIRLAAKGDQHQAEVYQSNAFYYKITLTDFLVSNLGQPSQASSREVDAPDATQFTTGDNTDGYTISAVALAVRVPAGATPKVSIYSDSSGVPGSSLKELTNPSNFSTTTTTEVEFEAGDYKLDPNTPYWVVIEDTAETTLIRVADTLSDSEDANGALDWNIGNASRTRIGGVGWIQGRNRHVVQIAVKGAPRTASADASLSDLVLKDASDNVVPFDPTFASNVESYAAAVANTVSQITVEAVRTADQASIQYLDGTDMALTDADTDTTAFDVALNPGENTFKIEVTSQDGLVKRTYTVTVTQADFLVSNLGQTSLTSPSRHGAAAYVATQFTTGSNPNGYTVSKVRLPISVAAASVTPVVAIYSNVSGSPGSSIKRLTNPDSITVSTTETTEVEFDAGDFKLDANTPYWIVIEKPDGSNEIYFETTNEDSEDAGFTRGWSIGNTSKFSRRTGTYTITTGNWVMQIAVKGALLTVSDDATLSGLVLKDADDNVVALDPTFASGVEEYTATVAYTVSQITVEPAKNDDNASIKYLDSNDLELMDADPSTPDLFDVVLAEGENVINVEVTAEDGTTVKTYTVTMTRVDFLVSNLAQANRGTEHTISSTTDRAQQFTTGTHAAGYTLSAVVADFQTFASGNLTFSIHETDDSGTFDVPGTNVVDLTGTPTTTGDSSFAPSSTTTLDPSTKYFVVFSKTTGADIALQTTDSDSVDPGEADGWDIADGSLRESSSVWTEESFSMKIAIKGEPITLVTNATGKPTISGPAQVGGALVADTSGISDPEGLTGVSYSYQWIRTTGGTDVDIPGATHSTYRVTSDDVGSTLKVKVTFMDDKATEEALTSDPTGIVTAADYSVPYTLGDKDILLFDETITAASDQVIANEGTLLEETLTYYGYFLDNNGNHVGTITPGTVEFLPNTDGGVVDELYRTADGVGTIFFTFANTVSADFPGYEEKDALGNDFTLFLGPVSFLLDNYGVFYINGMTREGLDMPGLGLSWMATDTIAVRIVAEGYDISEVTGPTPTVTTSATAGELEVSWSPAGGDIYVGSYRLRHRRTGSVGGWETQAIDGDQTSVTLTSLDPGAKYDVELRFENVLRQGRWSDTATGNSGAQSVTNSNAILDSLTLTANGTTVALEPSFSGSIPTYYASVPHSTETVTISATAPTGSSVAITPADSDILEGGHQIDVSSGATKEVSITVTAADSTTQVYTITISRPLTNVCERTAEVGDGIVKSIAASEDGISHCAQLTPTHLAELAVLALDNVVTIAADDLAGFTVLTDLHISNSPLLTVIPADLLSEVRPPLDTLRLRGTGLTTLPAGIFDDLADLRYLHLDSSELQSLPDGLFEQNVSLVELVLSSNPNSADFKPVANAGADRTVLHGDTVSLDGSMSHGGPWGSNVTYKWEQTSGTSVTLTDSDTTSPSFTAPNADAILEFTLTVTGKGHELAKGNDHSHSDTVTIMVRSSVASLSDLVLKDPGGNVVALDPPFATNVQSYTAAVAKDVEQITVEPTRHDPNAIIQYLDGGDAPLTDADPSTAGVFDVDLPHGETVIKVKVTASDNMTSTTYVVTVTRVDFLASNAGSIVSEASYSSHNLRPQVAIQFTTGSNALGYKIGTVQLRVLAVTTPRVSIYSDISGKPGSLLKALTNPGTIPKSIAWIDFDAADFHLDPDTPYWIVLDRACGCDVVEFRTTQTTAEDTGTATGWSIGDRLEETTSATGPWNPVSGRPLIPQLIIMGEPRTTHDTPNAAPTGRPVISGSPQRDQTLTVSTSGIRDDDGLSNPRYSYQWLRVDGASETLISTNSPSYILTTDDVGKKVKVVVGFFDDAGKAENLESDLFPASGTIQNTPNAAPTGLPTLSGTYRVGHTLTASTSGIGDRDGLTSPGYSYQWQRRDSGVYTDISGANQMVYTLSPDDLGKRVRVEVTFTDDDRNSHTLESSPSGTVQAQTSLPSYVVEEGKTVEITVTLAEAPKEGPVHIRFTTTPENGARRSEFDAWSSSSSDSLRFATGQKTDWIKIRPDDDTLNDDGETIKLCLDQLPDPYATLAGLNCATVNIKDNDDPNSVQVTFGRENYWASEDGNPAWPHVSVYPVPDRQITIPVTFTRGGGLSGEDYTITITSVTFGPDVHGGSISTDGRTYASRPIEIWALDDSLDDDGEYLDLAFGTMPPFVSVGATGKFSFKPTTTRVWFNDNEFTGSGSTTGQGRPPANMFVSFSSDTYDARENGTVATVEVRLIGGERLEQEVTIPIEATYKGGATQADTIYTEIPSSVTFKPGQTVTSFRIAARNDDVNDGGESVELSFGDLPTGISIGTRSTCDYGACSHGSTTINLVDNGDSPVYVFFEQAN